MQEFNTVHSKQEILESIRRNKRLGLEQSKALVKTKEPRNVSFLEWYVFNNLNTTPSAFVANLENQFEAEYNFRARRQRNIDFTRGRSWNEPVWDAELQKPVPNWIYLRRRNIPPLNYNLVSKLDRSLTGQFREINTGNVVKCDSQDDRGVELANFMTKCLERSKKNNKARGKDAANFHENLYCGRPVFKVMWGLLRNDKVPDVKFRVVNSAMFITNPGITDYDLDNLHTATEIHNASLNDILQNFAHGDYEKGIRLRDMYIRHNGNQQVSTTYSNQSFDGNQIRNNTFHNYGGSSYRYYESWVEICDYEAYNY